MLEKLSQLASLLISLMLFGVFVWWCFLFGAISPLRRTWIQVHPHPPPNFTPLPAFCCAHSQITAALRRPSYMPADQRVHSHWREAQIIPSDIHCCPVQHLSSRLCLLLGSDLPHSRRQPQQVLSSVLLTSHSWSPSVSFFPFLYWLIYLLGLCSQGFFSCIKTSAGW